MKYVMFTGTIGQMGGAQMYTSNKTRYMKSLGWESYVFSVRNENVIINDLKQYSNSVVPELLFVPWFYSKEIRARIVSRISHLIGEGDGSEIVIESSTPNLALWAELVAKDRNASHFCFILDENFDVNDDYIRFFRFKYKRKQLALINKKSYSLLFGNKGLRLKNYPVLSASCLNVVEDIDDEKFEKIDYRLYDYVICSLGRLDKGYIPSVVDGFESFAKNNADKKICYVFIGDQPGNVTIDMRSEIKARLDRLKNVSLFMMGYVYPIPSSFFDNVSVGVASAGSANVMWDNNVTTISIDANSFTPIGILGYTTNDSLFAERKIEHDKNLNEMLEDILVYDGLKNMEYHPRNGSSYTKAFSLHLDFMKLMDKSHNYYDVNGVHLYGLKNRLKKVLLTVLGYDVYQKVKCIFSHRGK